MAGKFWAAFNSYFFTGKQLLAKFRISANDPNSRFYKFHGNLAFMWQAIADNVTLNGKREARKTFLHLSTVMWTLLTFLKEIDFLILQSFSATQSKTLLRTTSRCSFKSSPHFRSFGSFYNSSNSNSWLMTGESLLVKNFFKGSIWSHCRTVSNSDKFERLALCMQSEQVSLRNID